MTSLARAERSALLDLLQSTGPAAPTLCEGWTTHDLAAHLFVRERRPFVLPGYVFSALSPLPAALEARARGRSYARLLEDLRSGPPSWSPLGGPDALHDATSLHEWYVHHEDVRRLVAPGRRELPGRLQDALWARLHVLGRLLTARASGLGITLVTPDARSLQVHRGPTPVVLRGAPGELLLWLFGRRSVADVQVDGDPAAVAAAHIGP